VSWTWSILCVEPGRGDPAEATGGGPGASNETQTMTTRDQVRRAVGTERADGVARGLAAEPAPSLPERLLAARERKGVDLYRAERDTKIRAHYLAALERGEYRELPGQVYTKGFLRNYALYLGLDPDEVLLQWRRERGDSKEPQAVIAVPRPLVAPRQGLTFSPSLVVFALLTVAVLAFAAYLGVQLLRFAKPPTIAVSDPASAVIDVDEDTTSYVFRGMTIPGGSVTITSTDQEVRTNADAVGEWSREVDLRRGENHFTVIATDPSTGKIAETPVQRLITVPYLVIQAPTLTISQPAEAATFENGAIPVEGRVGNAHTVIVRATWLGPTEPMAEGQASPAPPPQPEPVTVDVGEDGAFSVPYELTAGRWTITVTASNTNGKSTTLTRTVGVTFRGVNLVVTVDGGKAWIKVWVDGKVDEKITAAGRVVADGKMLTFTATESIEVRTGSSGFTRFTLNGVSLGALGRSGVPETWLFAPPAEPQQTGRR
jgi:cytoskeletal protein RodZ